MDYHLQLAFSNRVYHHSSVAIGSYKKIKIKIKKSTMGIASPGDTDVLLVALPIMISFPIKTVVD